MTDTDPSIFQPKSEADKVRWKETRRRVRLMTGAWREDLTKQLTEHLAITRVSNLGRPVLGINLLVSIATQLAVLYDQAPTVKIEDVDEEEHARFMAMLEDMQAFSILQRNAEHVIAFRENLVLIGWSESQQVPTLRLVSPDQVVVETKADDPHAIIRLKWARTRTYMAEGKRKRGVFWDVWDIEDEAAPEFRIENTEGVDVTTMFPGVADQVGQSYPYVDDDGKPFIPWVLYHAQNVGSTWDSHAWSELVEGTLDCAVLWSLFFHCCRDASWRQKYTIDLDLRGASITKTGSESAQEIETAPSSVLQFTSKAGSGSAGTFDAPIEPAKFANAALNYQRTVVAHIGVNPADIERTENANSGYAIQLKKSAQRRLGMRFEPQFRRGDLELLRKLALVHNIHSAEPDLPTEGFQITYHPIEETTAERAEELDLHAKMVEQGLMSRVEWYQRLHPGTSDDEAVQRLVEIEAVNRGIPAQADQILRALEQTDLTVTDVQDSPVMPPGEAVQPQREETTP